MTTHLQLTPGTIVGGDFQVLRALRAGGMGAVYVALQLSTGKERALKVMHPQLLPDTKLRERFEREARVSAMIESEHVVDVIGAGVEADTGMPWIAMELLEGGDLADHLASQGCMSASELLEVLRQLCHALGAAHRAGVVHRDVKPENVFVARQHSTTAPRAIKVLDFGIARVAALSKTTATATIGSPAWMAPEQTDPYAAITPATDVWPLGLMSFWLLTGSPFWKASSNPNASVHALMREILFTSIASATERARELGVEERLPDGFDEWFAQCVAREPSDRFQGASELLRGYEALLAMQAVGGSTPVTLGDVAPLPHSNTATPTKGDTAPDRAARGLRLAAACSTGAIVCAVVIVARQPDHPLARPGLSARATLIVDDVAQAPRSSRPPTKDTAPALPSQHPQKPGGRRQVPKSAAATPTALSPIGPSFASPPPFDSAVAQRAMARMAGKARIACGQTPGPRNIGLEVVWNHDGRVTTVTVRNVGARPNPHDSVSCVQRFFWDAQVLPFSGAPSERMTTIVVLD